MWKCWSSAVCVVNNQRHLQTDGERWRTIIGPLRSSAAAEEKSGSSRPAVFSTCQYFRRQSCSPCLFVSGEKRYLMEWVVVGQTRPGTLLRLIIRRNLPAPGSQKLCFHVNTGKVQAWSHLSLLCLLPNMYNRTLILMYFRLSSGSAWLVSQLGAQGLPLRLAFPQGWRVGAILRNCQPTKTGETGSEESDKCQPDEIRRLNAN